MVCRFSPVPQLARQAAQFTGIRPHIKNNKRQLPHTAKQCEMSCDDLAARAACATRQARRAPGAPIVCGATNVDGGAVQHMGGFLRVLGLAGLAGPHGRWACSRLALRLCAGLGLCWCLLCWQPLVWAATEAPLVPDGPAQSVRKIEAAAASLGEVRQALDDAESLDSLKSLGKSQRRPARCRCRRGRADAAAGAD